MSAFRLGINYGRELDGCIMETDWCLGGFLEESGESWLVEFIKQNY